MSYIAGESALVGNAVCMNELTPLAASAFPSLLLIVVGFVLVLVILGAFWWGSRRAARGKSPGPGPAAQPPAAARREDSWDTPEGGTGRRP
ncbi:DUF6479 family protein [Streptomyces sp. NPDC005017]|uniref:DUF6479 family protein n=1 Tax=Streptomyces sp. NPDC005017 TaxID=3364706 RepID=UPI0036756CD3